MRYQLLFLLLFCNGFCAMEPDESQGDKNAVLDHADDLYCKGKRFRAKQIYLLLFKKGTPEQTIQAAHRLGVLCMQKRHIGFFTNRRARSYFKYVIHTEPIVPFERAGALLDLGKLYIYRINGTKAEKCWLNVIDLSRQHTQGLEYPTGLAYYNLGKLYRRIDPQQALTFFEQAHEIETSLSDKHIFYPNEYEQLKERLAIE